MTAYLKAFLKAKKQKKNTSYIFDDDFLLYFQNYNEVVEC